jgi:hypothetical protein
MKKTKTKQYLIDYAYVTDAKDINLIKSDSEIKEVKNSDIPIMDLASTGSNISKYKIDKVNIKKEIVSYLKKKEEVKEVVEEPKVIQDQLSFDNFIDDFKI